MSRNLNGYQDNGAIHVDRYDRRVWSQINEESEKIQNAQQDEHGKLLRDVWASLYKVSPQINEEASLLNRKVMETMMNQTAWQDLRQTTQLDEYSAALGSLSLQDKMNQILPKNIKKQAQELQSLEQEAQRLLYEAQMCEDAANLMTNPNTQDNMIMKAESLRQQVNELDEAIEQASQALEQEFDSSGSQLSRALRQALEKTTQETQEREQAMRTWGAEPGSGQPVSGKERLELAQTLQYNYKLQEIAKLAGRMQMIALNKRRNRTTHPPTEVVDIGVGNDLAHVLPSELLLLADPSTEDEFIQRFAEARLLQYDLRGFEREGQGPIVVCIDESGSTEGTVEKWEKGIALSLFAIARREKRAFACIHFGNSQQIKVDVWDKPKDAKPSELVYMAEHFFNGGTDFERPLEEALKVMEQSAFRRGDIVFITDGEANVSDEFLHRFQAIKDQKEFHVISVVIGYDDHSIREFSDQIAKVQTVRDKDGDTTLNFIVESLN